MNEPDERRLAARRNDRELLRTGWVIVASVVGGVLFVSLMIVLFTSGEPAPTPPPPRPSLDPVSALSASSSLSPDTLAFCLAEVERRRREGRPVSLPPPVARKLLVHYRTAAPGFRYALALLRACGVEPDPAVVWKDFLSAASSPLRSSPSPELLRRLADWLRSFSPPSLPPVGSFDRLLASFLASLDRARRDEVPNAGRALFEFLKKAALHEGGHGDAPALMKSLRSALPRLDEASLVAAAALLRRFMDDEDLSSVHRLVTDPELSDAAYVALVRALASLARPASLRAVLSSLSQHPKVKASVVASLGAWDLTGHAAVLAKFLRSSDRTLASAAVRAFSASERNAGLLAGELPRLLPSLPVGTACKAVAALSSLPLEKLPLQALLDFAAKGSVQLEAVSSLLRDKGFKALAAAFRVPLSPLSPPRAEGKRAAVLQTLLVAAADREAGRLARAGYEAACKGRFDSEAVRFCLTIAAAAWRNTGDPSLRDFLRSVASSSPYPAARETALRLLRSGNRH